MYCKHCGNEISSETRFCGCCGKPQALSPTEAVSDGAPKKWFGNPKFRTVANILFFSVVVLFVSSILFEVACIAKAGRTALYPEDKIIFLLREMSRGSIRILCMATSFIALLGAMTGTGFALAYSLGAKKYQFLIFRGIIPLCLTAFWFVIIMTVWIV